MAGSVVGRCARGGRGAPTNRSKLITTVAAALKSEHLVNAPGRGGVNDPRAFRASDVNGPGGPASLAPCGHPPSRWVRNPDFQVRTRGRRADLPAAALVGDQAPPRWPRVRIPSLAFARIVSAVETFATGRASTPTPSGPPHDGPRRARVRAGLVQVASPPSGPRPPRELRAIRAAPGVNEPADPCAVLRMLDHRIVQADDRRRPGW